MGAAKMRITAVVVTHSRPDLLGKVVGSLQEQTCPLHRIVILDNTTDARTCQRFENSPGISIVRSDKNMGGAGGFMLGLKSAQALGTDWVWLLDDDAIPRREALAELVGRLPQLPATTAALCGTVIEYGNIALMHRRRFDWKFGMEKCVAQQEYRDGPVALDIGSFVGFLVSASALEQVGLPDASFFLAYDDTEFSLRLRKAGFSLWLVPSSVVDHMRCSEARLRSSEFGSKHYFNIRNRIVVKKAYAQYPRLSACSAAMVGLAMWVLCRGRFKTETFSILKRAISDGYAGRLGPFPESLNKSSAAGQYWGPLPDSAELNESRHTGSLMSGRAKALTRRRKE
jgi:rhamnopyranosyl-N-acetylglucosaminyl-diphospho-decaprenol beta-1,3/1,4-galactofuranosyltransferase